MANELPGCIGFLAKLLGFNFQHETEPAQELLPYRQRDNFLSPAELKFFLVLKQVTINHFHVCSKVRISDLLYVVDRWNNLGHANRIDRKHVDFVLCHLKTMQPILVIELDDSSHERADRQARDKLVDSAFAAADLPILHVICRGSYDDEELKQQIRTAIAPAEANPASAASASQANPPATLTPKPPASQANPLAAPAPQPPATPALPTPPPINKHQAPHKQQAPIDQEPECPKCNIKMVQRKASRGSNRGKRFWACPSYPDCRALIPID